MYEDVPFERWRFHAYVELMRGARGFQIAHGPGDPSLFRGLGGELERLKPALWSRDTGPVVRITPTVEHWSRRSGGSTYVIAATTHGLSLGDWKDGGAGGADQGRIRVTTAGTEARNEANSYGIGQTLYKGPGLHGIQNLPGARAYPAGRLVQWVRLDPKALPSGLAILVKGDGRFTHAASWGAFDVTKYRTGTPLEWFLNSLYRNAPGFLGWGKTLLNAALPYVPETQARLGAVPAAGAWTRLEVPFESIGVARKLVDGVAFLHEGGRVEWGRTVIESAGSSDVIWDGGPSFDPESMRRTRVEVAGLKAGTRVQALFEDREIVAGNGFFEDDFRGADLYQRFGGGPGSGYGRDPVALHVYLIPDAGR